MWLHRRSEEPSPTEVTCYWAKSKLSKVGTSVKFLTLKDFGAQKEEDSDEDNSLFFQELVKKGEENNSSSQLLKHYKSDKITNHLGLYQLMLKFVQNDGHKDNREPEEFLEFCAKEMDIKLCSEAAVKTTKQSDSALWFDLRYGRITASKMYNAAHCKKSDGTFVNQILGVAKLPVTEAMSRGIRMEGEVIKCLEKELRIKLDRIGLQLNPRYPIFGASPDAISEDYVVEIKCPQSEKTLCNYITKNREITARYKAQVQVQMFLFNKKKCLFCVADPNFEKNCVIHQIWVKYDPEYTETVMEAADCFWRQNIFPHLYKAAK